MVPKEIGSYYKIEKIGQGGMGIVFRGIHKKLEQTVAIKMLAPQFSDNPEMKKRFLREARLQARLSHPNVVNIFDYIEENGNLYLVMEYVRGKTLEEMLKSRGKLNPNEVLYIAEGVLSAVAFMHGQGIVHRDIKPSNIMLSDTGFIKVTDFGIARLVNDDATLTQAGKRLGTLYYMAPELIKTGQVTPSIDIYSFGITLYQLLTGKVPFPGKTEYEIIQGHLAKTPPPISQYCQDLHSSVENLVLKAIEKDPRKRFKSAQEFFNAVKETQTSLQAKHRKKTGAKVNKTRVFPLPKIPKIQGGNLVKNILAHKSIGSIKDNRRNLLVAVLIFLLILLLGIGGYIFVKVKSRPKPLPLVYNLPSMSSVSRPENVASSTPLPTETTKPGEVKEPPAPESESPPSTSQQEPKEEVPSTPSGPEKETGPTETPVEKPAPVEKPVDVQKPTSPEKPTPPAVVPEQPAKEKEPKEIASISPDVQSPAPKKSHPAPLLKPDEYYTRCNLRVIKGSYITWVNWQGAPTFIPAGTRVRIGRSGGKLTLTDLSTGRTYMFDVGATGKEYLYKFLTKNPLNLNMFSSSIRTYIKRAHPAIGMTKKEVYIAMGPPARISIGKTFRLTYNDIMRDNTWIWPTKRFKRNIGITFDARTGRVTKIVGIR